MAETVGSGLQEEQVVVFKLGGQSYGINITSVVEIIRLTKITAIPQAPGFVEGIINLRGKIIPVIDLNKRLGLETTEYTSAARIIVVETGEVVAGLMVNDVDEVIRFPASAVEPPPAMVRGEGTEFIRGIVLRDEQLIILLDPDRMFRREEQRVLRELEEEAV